MKHLVFIAIGGASGALARHWLSNFLHNAADSRFPLGTLSVNLLGSFCIGILYVVIIERGLVHPDWRSVLIVGFLGAFTTFSTFSLEIVALLENGEAATALAYVLVSVLTCIAAVWLSASLTRLLW